MRSFPTSSTPRPSGLRTSHLKEAVPFSSPTYAPQPIRALTDVVHPQQKKNSIRGGSSSLLSLSSSCLEKSGGLHPITVELALHHLISKYLFWAVCPVTVWSLSPLQLAVSVRIGCEANVHSISCVVNEGLPNHWVLLLDFSKAFNSIH